MLLAVSTGRSVAKEGTLVRVYVKARDAIIPIARLKTVFSAGFPTFCGFSAAKRQGTCCLGDGLPCRVGCSSG